jgi:hypothetical protein
MHFAVLRKGLAQAAVAQFPIYNDNNIGPDAVFVAQAILKARKALVQFLDQLPESLARNLDYFLASGQVAHQGGDIDGGQRVIPGWTLNSVFIKMHKSILIVIEGCDA